MFRPLGLYLQTNPDMLAVLLFIIVIIQILLMVFQYQINRSLARERMSFDSGQKKIEAVLSLHRERSKEIFKQDYAHFNESVSAIWSANVCAYDATKRMMRIVKNDIYNGRVSSTNLSASIEDWNSLQTCAEDAIKEARQLTQEKRIHIQVFDKNLSDQLANEALKLCDMLAYLCRQWYQTLGKADMKDISSPVFLSNVNYASKMEILTNNKGICSYGQNNKHPTAKVIKDGLMEIILHGQQTAKEKTAEYREAQVFRSCRADKAEESPVVEESDVSKVAPVD